LQRSGRDATISELVISLRVFHRLLVLALAAWMSLCCCEKRILAECLEESPAAAPSCCSAGCCMQPEESGQSRETPDDGHGSCCADGCCTKAAPDAPTWSLSLDLIGSPLLPTLAATADTPRCGHEPPCEDFTEGEPPPRLALIISRRLRI
jgi:hypothetical protein